MDVWKEDLPHCVVQDCVPFRAAAQKGNEEKQNDEKSDLIGFYLKRKGILIGFLTGCSEIVSELSWNFFIPKSV